MQKLPGAKQNLMKYEEHEFSFYGLKHSEGARDGDIYDLLNISLDNFPSMSVRKERRKLSYETGEKVYGIGSADKLFWCSRKDGSAAFYYDGEEKFPVEASEKTFSVINKYICIFPDKMYYSLWSDEAVALYPSLGELNDAMETSESIKDGDVFAVGTTKPYSFFQFNSQGKWKSATTENHAVQTRWIYLMDSWGSLEGAISISEREIDSNFMSGERPFEGVTAPYIAFRYKTSGGLPWIRIGDSVVIKKVDNDSGEVETEYAKVIGKEYVGDFSQLGDSVLFYLDKEISLSETSHSKVTIERTVPDLSFAFCHDNRLWGCEKDKIYASKLGDPFNFMDYSTLADASWTVGIASSEPFTGAVAYNGSPTFFKEDRIIKVSGNYPSQYLTYETADIPGVAKGSGKSLAICNGYLYYLSPEGVCAYSGSYPSIIGDDIGEVLSNGYGGAGGDKYYLEASVAYGKAVYVYDTRTRAWTKENALDAIGFTDIGRDLYALTKSGIYLLDSVKDEGTAETSFESFIEFAPIYDSHLTKKGVSRIHVSLKVNTGASVRFLLSYDGEGYKEVFSIAPSMRRNYNIPLTVRRCGYYSLKITGSGSYTVYGIGRERYFGSDM